MQVSWVARETLENAANLRFAVGFEDLRYNFSLLSGAARRVPIVRNGLGLADAVEPL